MTRDIAVPWVALLLASSCGANVYWVRNTNDSGPRSLRWAIEQANSHAGRDEIQFAAKMDGKVITPLSALPTITDRRTIVDGDIDDDGIPDVAINGKQLSSGIGLDIDGADHCVIRGVAVTGFPSYGIRIVRSRGCRIVSCHVGVNLAGTKAVNNGQSNIVVVYSDDCTVGGTRATQRNIIAGGSGTDRAGIELSDGSYHTVSGNTIGLARDGVSVLGSDTTGILMWQGKTSSHHHTIGGTTAAERNVIGGVKWGIYLDGAEWNTIQGNYIGLAADGDTLAPISNWCIWGGAGAANNTIGGTTAAARNVFAGGAGGVGFGGDGADDNTVQGNYFGLNAAGTRQRQLSTAILVGEYAGSQTIGGNTEQAGNYITPKHPVQTTFGIILNDGSKNVVSHNKLGLRADGIDASEMDYAILLQDGNGEIIDNKIIHAHTGVRVQSGSADVGIFRNAFRRCEYAVNIMFGGQCTLGKLGNAATDDDGGNRFRPSNTWNIRNETPYLIKAEGNNFGTTVRSEINAKIWDRRDDGSLGRVDFSPLMGGVLPTGSTLAVTGAAAVPTGLGGEILFNLSAPADVTVSVLNIAGRPVATVVPGRASEAGLQRVVWNGRSDRGTRAPSGTYLFRITARDREGRQAQSICALRLAR